MADKKKSRKIGSMRKGDYGLYLKLDDGVEVFRDGVKLELNNNCLNVQDPKKNIEFLRDNDYISDEEAEKRLSNLEDKDWLKAEIIVPKVK